MKRSEVGRASRIIDVASLALLAAGGLLYLGAFVRMENLRTRPHEEFVPFQTEAWARTREHARLTRMSQIGLVVAGVGMVVGLSAAGHAYIIAGRRDVQG